MIARAFMALCDECGREQLIFADNLADAKQEAKARGWITTKGRECYCSQECHLRQSIRRITAKEENNGANLYIPQT